jgi:hypothetical protein
MIQGINLKHMLKEEAPKQLEKDNIMSYIKETEALLLTNTEKVMKMAMTGLSQQIIQQQIAPILQLQVQDKMFNKTGIEQTDI